MIVVVLGFCVGLSFLFVIIICLLFDRPLKAGDALALRDAQDRKDPGPVVIL
jgi:hypothetical protein